MAAITRNETWTCAQLAEAVGGELSGGAAEAPVAGGAIDTRALAPGAAFFAFKGARTDGHDHVEAAARAGAACAVVTSDCDAPDGFPLVRVDDAERALVAAARAWRKKLTGRVIAVAGSAGKTTTKNLIARVLEEALTGTVSPASFNNRLGVSVTLLNADPAHDYVICEIGTNAPGENEELSLLARPTLAVIVSLGREHLEGLGDLAGVAAEEAAVCAGLDGPLVCAHEPLLLDATAACAWRKTFGARGDLRVAGVREFWSGVRFELSGEPFETPLLGAHNAYNAAAAVAVGRIMGLEDDQIRDGLGRASAPPMRMEPRQLGAEPGGIKLLRDEYNAHPESLDAAVRTLGALPCGGRRVLALGDMLELGPASAELHAEAGRAMAGTDLVLLFGPEAAHAAGGLNQDLDAGVVPTPCRVFDRSDAAIEEAAGLIEPGDTVLVKASRGVRLERLSEALIARFGG